MRKTMSSKERVLATLAQCEPDRVPMDYEANSAIDLRLKQHFGLAAHDGEALRQALGVDFRQVNLTYTGPEIHEPVAGMCINPEWGIRTRWIEHETGGYWDYCGFPLKDATLDEVESWPMPNPDHYDYAGFRETCKRLSPYAVYLGNPGLPDIINSTGMLFGMDDVLVGLIAEEPAVLRFIEKKVAIQLEVTRRAIVAAEGHVDILWMGEDLGTQIAPMLSLALYRSRIRPHQKPFIELARHHSMPVIIHTCGCSSWAYEDFIAMGARGVSTLQPEAANMAPAHLKQSFGGRLAFHGCISTAGALASGTVADVEKTVRETLEIMKPGGGYCLAPTHQIQDNTPTENVLAMYAAAQRFGQYN